MGKGCDSLRTLSWDDYIIQFFLIDKKFFWFIIFNTCFGMRVFINR